MAFLGLLSYIFMEFLRPEVLFASLQSFPILRITALFTILAWVFEMMGGRGTVSAPHNKFLLLFLFMIPISILIAESSIWHARHAFADFLKVVLIYYVLINTVNSVQRFNTITNLIMAVALYLAIGGIMQVIFAKNMPGFLIEKSGRLQYSGVYSDSNDFAQVLLVGLGLYLHKINIVKSKMVKWMLVVSMFILIFTIFLTASRGAMLALATVFFFYFKRKKGLGKGGLILLVLGLLFLALAPALITDRMGTVSASEGSAHGRIEAWTEGWYMFLSNPISGVGKGFFREHFVRTAHNSMILVGAEMGGVGLFLWLGMIYLSYSSLINLKQKIDDHSTREYANMLIDSMTCFWFSAFFLSRSYILLPYLLIGLSVALCYNINKVGIKLRKVEIKQILVLEVVCIIVWKITLILGWST